MSNNTEKKSDNKPPAESGNVALVLTGNRCVSGKMREPGHVMLAAKLPNGVSRADLDKALVAGEVRVVATS